MHISYEIMKIPPSPNRKEWRNYEIPPSANIHKNWKYLNSEKIRMKKLRKSWKSETKWKSLRIIGKKLWNSVRSENRKESRNSENIHNETLHQNKLWEQSKVRSEEIDSTE